MLLMFMCCVVLCSGTLIRRHRIPLPPPHDDQFYTVDYFNVGNQIMLYSKVFQITVGHMLPLYIKVDSYSNHSVQGCDKFTENFLGKVGVRVNLPLDVPSDPYTKHREKVFRQQQYCY